MYGSRRRETVDGRRGAAKLRCAPVLLVLLGGLVMAGHAAGAETPEAVQGYFAHAPELKLKSSESVATVSVASPTLFGPSSGGAGHSFYVFGIGQLIEVRMDSGAVARHEVPFDRTSRGIYDAGANAAWLGPDLKIYFGLQGKPARVGRFDPATGKMELLGELAGHTVMRHLWGPENKCYVITYPATLSEIDAATGKARTIGRLAYDALYVPGEMWVGQDGRLYTTAGQRPPRKVGVNLATGEIKLLEEFPKVAKQAPPAVDFPDGGKLYDVQVTAVGDKATVAFGPKGQGERKEATFACSTVDRDIEAISVGPDGRVWGCGSYNIFALDPATGKAERLDFSYNIYDFINVGSKLFFGGYPNARVGVLDTAKPLQIGRERVAIWTRPGPEHNPRQMIEFHAMKDTSDAEGKALQQKRIWSMVKGADGKLYIACSATRQNRGGALVILDPETGEAKSLREPYFRLLGVSALCEIDGGKMIGIVTWVSPDPRAEGQEPDAAKLFVYDVGEGRIVLESVPMPGCKVLTALCQAPGTRTLVGLGLPGVTPANEADDDYSGNGEIFFFPLDGGQGVKRVAFDFPLNSRTGRPIVPAPDGTLWMSGGGGILRVDGRTKTVEPVARCGARGNMAFVGNTMYMSGGPRVRYGDVSGLLRPIADGVGGTTP